MKKSNNTLAAKKGFTIIEVVLVLAIAALIFVMVFIALPALQSSQRNTQRKSDLSRIAAQISQYQSSSRGAIPPEGSIATFVNNYLNGAGGVTGDEYLDPSGNKYKLEATTTPKIESTADPTKTTIGYKTGKVCGAGGAIVNGTSRQYVLLMALEGQSAKYCLDNK